MLDRLKHVDWILYAATLPLLAGGLVSIYVFRGDNGLFGKQVFWISFCFLLSLVIATLDTRLLRSSRLILAFYGSILVLLLGLMFSHTVWNGAKGWINLGFFAFQPAEPMKLALILVLAKYFSRRHVEIARIKHIFISLFYALLPAIVVLRFPDLGSAIIYLGIWLGMTLVSGINKKHLIALFAVGLIAAGGMWSFYLKPFQKARITTFLYPEEHVQGTGWHVYQAKVAIGSGEVMGKGIGEGTQSRLKFLPEHETDFIFSSFAEEWGFIGVIFLFVSFGVIIFRIIGEGLRGATNFETLFASGFAVFLIIQFGIHVGMNLGLMPVTGRTLPFVSYGGSHLLVEFIGIGLLMGMRRWQQVGNRKIYAQELVGID